jgi:hypothetical protein
MPYLSRQGKASEAFSEVCSSRALRGWSDPWFSPLDMLDREERIAGPDTMPAAQIGNPSADLMFPSDSKRVRSGSARRRSLKPRKSREK